MSKQIYLDHAAATPLDQRVFKAMQPYFAENFYNPSAPYQPARDVRKDIEEARATCASILGVRPAEIIFTAGATESINLAFGGILKDGGHCVVSSIEHMAILETAHNFNHSLVLVNERGRLETDNLIKNIRNNTTLVSVSLVNNEIGVVQDIKCIAGLLENVRQVRLAEGNKTPLYFHTDATQAAGYLDLSVARLGVDLLTLGGDKIYGPKQMGLLYKKSSVQLHKVMHGGGQEQSFRSGTENVPGIIGFSAALSIAMKLRRIESSRVHALNSIFVSKLVELFPNLILVGDQKHTTPHIAMLAWPGMDGERLIFRLENEGVLANTGAACAAKKEGYSHVLKALGLSEKIMTGSLRFSFGRGTTENDILRAVKIIGNVINKERS